MIRYLPGLVALALVIGAAWKEFPAPFEIVRLMPSQMGWANFIFMIALIAPLLFFIVMGCVWFMEFDKKYRARNRWAKEVLTKKR